MKLVKYALSLFFCNSYRFLRIIPNNDPIMGCMLPFSRQGRWWQGALFALIAMASFDFVTMKLGIWTIVTSMTYAALGILFHFAYKSLKKVKLRHYLGSGVIGVLIFDFVTGVIFGPALFGMSFLQAFIGQIPFTVMHLVTVTGFILVLTPVLDAAIVSNSALEDSIVWNKLKTFAGA